MLKIDEKSGFTYGFKHNLPMILDNGLLFFLGGGHLVYRTASTANA